MPVTSHEIYPAVAYGADGVEHIRGTSRRGFSPKNSETRQTVPRRDRSAGGIGMTLTPTIGIQGGHQLLTLRDGSWLDDPRITRLFPASASAPSEALRCEAGGRGAISPRVRRWSSPQERWLRPSSRPAVG